MKIRLSILSLCCLLMACGPSVKKEDLYGIWKYTKIENPNQGNPNTSTPEELKENDPSISFSSKDSLVMRWGGKVLSHGTFKIEYPNIVYDELLPAGKKRTIRFLIKEFADDTLVFQTQEADAVRVTAKRSPLKAH